MKIPSITQIVSALSTRADLNDCQMVGQKGKTGSNPKERDG